MGDDTQIIEDAEKVLGEIISAYRGQPLAKLASRLRHSIAPRMTFDAKPDLEELTREYERIPKEFADEATKAIAKRSPTYTTPIFKCVGDFEKCKKSGTSARLCQAALAICIGKHLIPFTK